jgi:RsiW-degrading membrane proteinase PrsW (M82 family)
MAIASLGQAAKMGKKSQKKRSAKSQINERAAGARESSSAEAATVAWTVSVTMVVACDVAAIAAHLYLLRHPGERPVAVLAQLMLFGGAVIGLASLILLPIVRRMRRVPPPTGFTVFAACAAAAPVLALVARAVQ